MIDLAQFQSERTVHPGSKVVAITTGSFLFDYVTGIGGLPRGRMVEGFGPESSGKSTAFYQAGAHYQRAGGGLVLLDYEAAYTDSYVENLGVDLAPGKLLVEQPDTLEEGFEKAIEITEKLAASHDPAPMLFVFDSVAAMPMEDEDPGQNTAAMTRAKKIRAYLRKANGAVARAGATWVFINHEMDNIFTGAPWEINRDKARKGLVGTPGGKAIKFYSSMRFQFAAGSRLKGDVVDPVTGEVLEGIIAIKSKVTTVKNKLAAPFRTAEMFIRFGAGIDNTFSLVDVAVRRGIIEKPSKLIFQFPDGGTANGAANAIAYLQSRPSLASDIEEQVRQFIHTAWAEEQERLRTAAVDSLEESEEDD